MNNESNLSASGETRFETINQPHYIIENGRAVEIPRTPVTPSTFEYKVEPHFLRTSEGIQMSENTKLFKGCQKGPTYPMENHHYYPYWNCRAFYPTSVGNASTYRRLDPLYYYPTKYQKKPLFKRIINILKSEGYR